MSTIGERLKEVRGSLSQDDFSKSNNIHRVTLSRFEKGDRTPDSNFLTSVITKYSVCSEWLLFGTGPMRREEQYVASTISPTPEAFSPFKNGKTSDTSDVLNNKNSQHTEIIDSENLKTSDGRTFSNTQQEIATLQNKLLEIYERHFALQESNAALRVDLEQKAARIAELERENIDLRSQLRVARISRHNEQASA